MRCQKIAAFACAVCLLDNSWQLFLDKCFDFFELSDTDVLPIIVEHALAAELVEQGTYHGPARPH